MQKTDFGFQQVPWEQKQTLVNRVFHSVASRYDLMNDLMSLGIHRLWKRALIHYSDVRPGQQVLDLAGGTGDVAALMAPIVGNTGKVTLCDINADMLNIGRERLENKGLVQNIDYVEANAEALPFPIHYFDLITIAFGLRNVRDKQAALQSMQRVLKPGGKIWVLEFSKPTVKPLQPLYDFYSFQVLPRLGKWIAKDADSYQYLAESIRKHPDQHTLQQMMEQAGFTHCRYINLSAGIVALHTGTKP